MRRRFQAFLNSSCSVTKPLVIFTRSIKVGKNSESSFPGTTVKIKVSSLSLMANPVQGDVFSCFLLVATTVV